MLKNYLIFLILIISLFILNSLALSQDDGDGQFWNTNRFEIKLSTTLKIELEEEFRFGNQASNLYYHHTDGYLACKLINWLEFGASYRQIFELKKNEWQREDRPHINAILRWNWLGIKFKNRNRFEYRIRDGKENEWRYRNKFDFPLPVSWTKYQLNPFISNEFFYEFDNKILSRNRLYSGFAVVLYEKIKVKIFYLWQSSKKNEKWIDYNALGLQLIFKN